MLDAAGGDLTHAAEREVSAALWMYTPIPPILLYTGNHPDKHRVSGRRVYYKRGRVRLETNFPPNALKYKTRPSRFCGAVYDYTTLFKFEK